MEYQEDYLYTDFGGDTQALGKPKCKHLKVEQMGFFNLFNWVICADCGHQEQIGKSNHE